MVAKLHTKRDNLITEIEYKKEVFNMKLTTKEAKEILEKKKKKTVTDKY